MYKLLHSKISQLFDPTAPTTGIGIFRFLFGLVTLQEICFLLYFNHLIFDPIPFLDVEFPMIPYFLFFWGIVAFCVSIGYRTQQAIITNYILWIIFVNFTPMQRDFDGGFDLFMIGSNFFMIFMPIAKSFSVDNLIKKLNNPFKHYSLYQKPQVSVLAYHIPVFICLGFLYFDSGIHKMFAEHWRNGLGAWLPATMPYYISAIDMSWLLNKEIFQKSIGYLILVFQFSFIFLHFFRPLRPLYFIVGAGLHIGITITLNIYPFGIGMLIFYSLVAPFSWYRKAHAFIAAKTPSLTVFYDEQCPLCCRTVLIINHFDFLNCIDFKGAQEHAVNFPALSHIDQATLLTDLYALNTNNILFSGVETYAQILINMRYLAPFGYLLKLPGIYQFACKKYRNIADSRVRIPCNEYCEIPDISTTDSNLYDRIFNSSSLINSKRYKHRLSKILLLFFLLQLNSSIHYGIFYRIKLNNNSSVISALISELSNTLVFFSHTFVGITPHALYLHDHFEGYNHVIALTYLDKLGKEQWLPFVTPEGRLISPNWGRVHSMWANIAVTPNIDNHRLSKFIMKTTAFWGIKTGLKLNSTTFNIKLKKISAPSFWVKDQLSKNLTGSWKSIGTATWKNKTFNLTIPENINTL